MERYTLFEVVPSMVPWYVFFRVTVIDRQTQQSAAASKDRAKKRYQVEDVSAPLHGGSLYLHSSHFTVKLRRSIHGTHTHTHTHITATPLATTTSDTITVHNHWQSTHQTKLPSKSAATKGKKVDPNPFSLDASLFIVFSHGQLVLFQQDSIDLANADIIGNHNWCQADSSQQKKKTFSTFL